MGEGRGALTDAIQEKAKAFLGDEMTIRQLRMLPYIQYQLTNDLNIDPNHITAEEREVLMDWRDKGYLSEPASALRITKAFWDFMCEIIWLSYVDYACEMLPEAAES